MTEAKLATRLADAEEREDRIAIIADWVLTQFDQFYREFLDVPHAARAAFESTVPDPVSTSHGSPPARR